MCPHLQMQVLWRPLSQKNHNQSTVSPHTDINIQTPALCYITDFSTETSILLARKEPTHMNFLWLLHISHSSQQYSIFYTRVCLKFEHLLQKASFPSTQEGSTCEPLKLYSFQPTIPTLLQTTNQNMALLYYMSQNCYIKVQRKNYVLLAILLLLIRFPIPLQFWSHIIVVYHIRDHHQSLFYARINWVLVLTATVWCSFFLKI